MAIRSQAMYQHVIFSSSRFIMKATKVRFSQESLTKNEEAPMDPELASRLYKDGGFLVIKDLPEGTEFGIDMNSWNTGL